MDLTIPKIQSEGQLVISSKARKDLEDLFLNDGLNKKIVLVRGPSGCGKDTLIRYLAKKYGYKVKSDRDIEDELEATKTINQSDYAYFEADIYDKKLPDGVSYVKIFCDVFDRVTFERMARKRILYYLRDIPTPYNDKERAMMRESIARLTSQGNQLDIVPIIFNLNSNIYDEYHFMSLFPTVFHGRIHQVACVQTNQTNIEKALGAVCELNNMRMFPQEVRLLARAACLDMSAALNLLRTHKFLKNQQSEKDLTDSNIFHRVGKILYNKRKIFSGSPGPGNSITVPRIDSDEDEDEDVKIVRKLNRRNKGDNDEGSSKETKDSKRFEGREFDLHRKDHYFDLLDLVRRQNNFSRVSQTGFRGIVQENYLDFCGDIKDVAKISRLFCKYDTYDNCLFMDRDEGSRVSWDEYITALYCFGFMNNSRHDNKDRRRLFNFQFPKHLDRKRDHYLSRYDYWNLPKEFIGEDGLSDPQIDLNPEDDIDSGDSSHEPPVVAKKVLQGSVQMNAAEIEDLEDELADILMPEPKGAMTFPIEIIGGIDSASPPTVKRLITASPKSKKVSNSSQNVHAQNEPINKNSKGQPIVIDDVCEEDLDELLDEYLEMQDKQKEKKKV